MNTINRNATTFVLASFVACAVLLVFVPEWIYFYESLPPRLLWLFPFWGGELSLSTLYVWTPFSYVLCVLLACGAGVSGGLLVRAARTGSAPVTPAIVFGYLVLFTNVPSVILQAAYIGRVLSIPHVATIVLAIVVIAWCTRAKNKS